MSADIRLNFAHLLESRYNLAILGVIPRDNDTLIPNYLLDHSISTLLKFDLYEMILKMARIYGITVNGE
jgi:hypothetical protein